MLSERLSGYGSVYVSGGWGVWCGRWIERSEFGTEDQKRTCRVYQALETPGRWEDGSWDFVRTSMAGYRTAWTGLEWEEIPKD